MSSVLLHGYLLRGKSYVYKIEKVLGQGTFGITYLATTRVKVSGALGEIETKLKVAVKEFFMKDINGRCDSTVTCSSSGDLYADYRRKFAREATNLSQLKHPHIVKVLELFEANNTYYYSMEYCEEGTLDALIEKHRGLDVQSALSYFWQIADALSFMHENRMLHLDLKPSNIMLRGNGEAVLIDFGLSKQYTASGAPESSTRVGSGTQGYAPIEQANYREGNDFPVTMDVYALGATLFKMLTGVRPPEASMILNNGFPTKELQDKGIGKELISCISISMSPVKKQRYQSVGDLILSISAVLEKSVKKESLDQNDSVEVEIDFSGKEPKQDDDENLKVTVENAPLMLDSHSDLNSINKPSLKGITNGHEWVDLGLSVKWATCNVGAETVGNIGDYYAWGEKDIKFEYGPDNSITCGKKMADISGSEQFDVARIKWGAGWRIPTRTEFKELMDDCSWRWVRKGEHKGFLITSSNGNSIFLPAAGWHDEMGVQFMDEHGIYWTSTPQDSDPYVSCCLYFYANLYLVNSRRYYGASIRPVFVYERTELNEIHHKK